MLFPQGVFAPELVADPAPRRPGRGRRPGRRPHPAGDFLAAGTALGIPASSPSFSRPCGPVGHLEELAAALSARRMAGRGPAPRTPPGVHAAGPAATGRVRRRAARQLAAVLDGVALDLLLHFMLAHLTDAERPGTRPRWTRAAPPRCSATRPPAPIDPRAAAGPGRPATARRRTPLPPAAAAGRLRGPYPSGTHGPRPCRVPLRRRAPVRAAVRRPRPRAAPPPLHHVLLAGERGVGKSTLVAELARRAAAGADPLPGRKRGSSASTAATSPPDESRPRLAAILAHVADRPELVVCLDGFPALLRGERAASNKPVLLAGAGPRPLPASSACSPPASATKSLSDDPDFAEFFARVDVEEPDPDTALRLLRHFALGLSERFRVRDRRTRPSARRSASRPTTSSTTSCPPRRSKLLHRACEDVDYERGQLRRGRATGSPPTTWCGWWPRSAAFRRRRCAASPDGPTTSRACRR